MKTLTAPLEQFLLIKVFCVFIGFTLSSGNREDG